MALYSDTYTVFKHNACQPETAADATQFTRSLPELGIRQIFARSPQAKGRLERAMETFQPGPAGNRTTPGRCQDFGSGHGGAAGLPAPLQRSLRRPAGAFEPAYRPAGLDLALSKILCFKDTRKVARDNPLQYNRRVRQLLPDQARTSYAKPKPRRNLHLQGGEGWFGCRQSTRRFLLAVRFGSGA